MRGAWKPGAYIERRRKAAGLSLDDVAAELHTIPHPVGERERRLWLASIEADVAPIPANIGELRRVFPFDLHVLHVLVVRQSKPDAFPHIHICRICACSDRDACVGVGDGIACAWAEQDLCTACALPAAAAAMAIAS